MKKAIIFLSTIFFLSVALQATPHITAKKEVVKNGYNFWLYEPDSISVSTPKPVIIFLHGASLCGRDMNRVRHYGTIDAIERGREIDAYVVAPQNPGGAWRPENVMNVVKWVEQNHNVDTTRIYVIGMSLGGYGAIDVAAAYPDRIAAAMSFCGGGSRQDLGSLNEVPLWIVHGTADRAVRVGESDRVVNEMRRADPSTPRLIYDRVPGMNHSKPARFFYLPEAYDWLMSHSLTDEGRPATQGFDITGSSTAAYKGLKSTGKSKLKIHKRSKVKSKTSKRKHASKSTRKRSRRASRASR